MPRKSSIPPVERTCAYAECGKQFRTWPSQIKNGLGLYCCSDCRYKAQRRPVSLVCANTTCQKVFVTTPKYIKLGRRFCSNACKGVVDTKDPVARFWGHVDKRGPDECWLWKNTPSTNHYAKFSVSSEHEVGAHRFSLELALGRPIMPGLFALHTCPGGDTPSCVNPSHLREGTPQMNTIDAVERNRLPLGSRHHRSKLTEDDVLEMIRLRAQGQIYKQIAARFGVSPQTVHRATSGKNWKHVTELTFTPTEGKLPKPKAARKPRKETK